MTYDLPVAKDIEGDILRVGGQVAPLDADTVATGAEGYYATV